MDCTNYTQDACNQICECSWTGQICEYSGKCHLVLNITVYSLAILAVVIVTAIITGVICKVYHCRREYEDIETY